MVCEIAIGRDKAVKILRPVEEPVDAAQLGLVGNTDAVELEVGIPLTLSKNHGLVGVAIAEGRGLSLIQIRNAHHVLGPQDGGVGRVPAHAQVVFEKGIDGIKRAPVIVAGQVDVARVCANHEGFLGKSVEPHLLEAGWEKRTGAHEDQTSVKAEF